VADVCGQGGEESHEGGDQHRVTENLACSEDLGHAAARQLRHHVAPEEAAQNQILGRLVPIETSLRQLL